MSIRRPDPPSLGARRARAGLLLLLPAALSAQIVPLGGDFAISQPDGDHEGLPSVAADRRGGWGVTWDWDDLEFAVGGGRAQRLDRDGQPVPGALRGHELGQSDLGLDGAGNGVVAGVREQPALGGADVAAFCVDPAGAPRGATFRVDAGDITPATRRPGDVRVAVDSGGAFVVAWQENPRVAGVPPSVFYRRFDAACQPLGGVASLGAVGEIGRREPHLAIRPEGGFVLVWIEGEDASNHRVVGRRYDREGGGEGESFEIAGSSPRPGRPAVAAAPGGGFAVVWETRPAGGSSTGVAARVFDAQGAAAGGELVLRTSELTSTYSPSVASVGGRYVAAWGENGFVEEGSAVYARAFTAAGPDGPEVQVNEQHTDPGRARLAALGGSELVVVWDDLAEQTLPGDIVARRFVLLPAGEGCSGGETALCLDHQRFRVEVEWRDFEGRRGVGRAVEMTSDSGLFWFFDATNLEVLVKVLDACSVFDRHWVFAAATTNVEYTLVVTDSATGRSRSYFNPLGTSSPAVTDADAFATCP